MYGLHLLIYFEVRFKSPYKYWYGLWVFGIIIGNNRLVILSRISNNNIFSVILARSVSVIDIDIGRYFKPFFEGINAIV